VAAVRSSAQAASVESGTSADTQHGFHDTTPRYSGGGSARTEDVDFFNRGCAVSSRRGRFPRPNPSRQSSVSARTPHQ
jgi:hypothetical protein